MRIKKFKSFKHRIGYYKQRQRLYGETHPLIKYSQWGAGVVCAGLVLSATALWAGQKFAPTERLTHVSTNSEGSETSLLRMERRLNHRVREEEMQIGQSSL